ncbi:conserved hypothetical protein [Marinoscillum sp. 108]|nr:conserved hypothetical protein [Marinoscillum sp. 108]
MKFGKLDMQELTLKECSFYPEAKAMVIAEYGDLRFNYLNDNWTTKFTITRRIKIFTTEGKNQANVSIRLYDPVDGGIHERLSSVKAITHNLVDGRIEKTPLNQSEVFRTRLSDHRTEISFTLPNVQVGSVIDYEIILISNYLSVLFPWKFQKSIPTKVSEIRYVIPEYFNYITSQLGTSIELTKETNSVHESFKYKWESEPGIGGNKAVAIGAENSVSKEQRFVARNILPLEDEPNINNKPDLPARLEFQLVSSQMPNSAVKFYADNYESFTKDILTWESFGKTLDQGAFASPAIKELRADSVSDLASAIYHWIQNHFSFTNEYGVTNNKAGKIAFNEGSGNVPAINLTLIAALREAGINAYPIILSTRGHGIPHPVYPNYEDFNYVIVGVKTEAGLILADATTKLSFGTIPERCLNGKGWLVDNEFGQWVDLKKEAHYSSEVSINMTLEETQITSELHITHKNYAGVTTWEQVDSIGATNFIQEIDQKLSDWDIENFNIKSGTKESKEHFEFEITASRAINANKRIYISPFILGMPLENPFRRPERVAPIDFPYGFEYRVIAQIKIPDGYSAILPESGVFKLQSNDGSFIYSTNQVGNTINLVGIFKISKTEFNPNEYQNLKQFYQLVTDKNQELIVLNRL